MEILKFNENIINTEDRVFKKFGKDLYKRTIDSYKSKGYTLYYYDRDNFELIEIPSVRKDGITGRFKWKVIWGEIIFFLNDEEYNDSMKVIKTSKDLHDKYLEQAKNVADMPMSTIYYNVLKINK